MSHVAVTGKHRARRGRRRLAVALAAALALVATMLNVGLRPGHAAAASDIGGLITSPEVAARADYWYQQQVPYSQGASAWDLGHTMQYRTDCGGLADMALHLAGVPNTGSIPGYNGGGGSYFDRIGAANHSLTPADVHPGDVFDDQTDGHAFIFEAWDWDRVHFSYYNFGGGSSGTAPPEHHTGETFAQNEVGYEPLTNYVIYRYHNLIDLGYNSTAPDVAVTPTGQSYAFWKGTNGDLFEAQGTAGGSLNGPIDRGYGTLGSAPSAGVDGTGATYVYWRGSGSSHDLFEAFWNGTDWVGPFDRGMGPLGSAPSVAITKAGKAYVFWTGTNGDLFEAQGPADGALDGPVDRGYGTLGSAPTAGIDSNNATYVYWRGSGPDHDLIEAYWNGTDWVGPVNRGMGPLGSAPSVAVNGAGKAYVFWTGTNADLYEAVGPADSPLTGPTARGFGILGSAPTVGIDSSNATYVYWKGSGNNHDLFEAYWNGNSWSGPNSHGMGPLG